MKTSKTILKSMIIGVALIFAGFTAFTQETTQTEATVVISNVKTKTATGKVLLKTKKGVEYPYLLVNGKKKYNLETIAGGEITPDYLISLEGKSITATGYLDDKGKTISVTKVVDLSQINFDGDAK